MPHTHHSHSGQFCNHAKNTLAEVFTAMVKNGMTTIAMTEHIPRSNKYLYPGELEAGYDLDAQEATFEAYVVEARRLRSEFQASGTSQSKAVEILIGLEGEWVDPVESPATIRRLIAKHDLDYFMGSIHHVRSIPIDYDRAHYENARSEAGGGTDPGLFMAFFEEQGQMLKELKPRVVGHFDLIRLLSDKPNEPWTNYSPELWTQIEQNLKFIKSYGGALEMNTSALRKGLSEPYPRSEICQKWMSMGGQFMLSDDSHGVDHIGTCYPQALQFMRKIGLQSISYLSKEPGAKGVVLKSIPVDDLQQHPFFTKLAN